MTRKGDLGDMEGGYPAEADIFDMLYERGIELIRTGEAPYVSQYIKATWALLNAFDWASVLGVYCPSPTTFNVRGGKYLFKDQVKTYTPGDAVDPTDNDTTYIWLTTDNAIGSGIDGNGWPNAEHIKLAEIDVDSDGNITAIRDLRGQAFLQYFSENALIDKILCYEGEVLCYENNVLTY